MKVLPYVALLVPLVALCTASPPSFCDQFSDRGMMCVSCKCKQRHDNILVGMSSSQECIALHQCHIANLTKHDMDRFPNLKSFTISHSGMLHIAEDTFEGNRDLEDLALDTNKRLNKKMLLAVLCKLANENSNLRSLDLHSLGLTNDFLEQALPCISRMQLANLSLAANNIQLDALHVQLASLSKVRKLDIGSTFPMTSMSFLASLKNLQTLRISSNNLLTFPTFQWQNGSSIIPNLTSLYIDYNDIWKLPNISIGLNKLTFLSIRQNHIERVYKEDIERSFPNLETLFLSNNRRLIISNSSFPATLRRLELRDCKITFDYFSMNVFKNLHTLEGLDVSINQIALKDDLFGELFSGLHNLKFLSLQNSGIQNLPSTTFRGLTKLESLVLDHNALSILVSDLFIDLKSLTKLHVSYNKLSTIDRFPLYQVWPHLELVDFSGNPFLCDCGLQWFLDVFHNSNVTFVNKYLNRTYLCAKPNNMHNVNLSKVVINPRDCVHMKLEIKLTSAGATVVVVLLLVLVLTYKYRWHLGYLYFLLKAKRRESRAAADTKIYTYDAFVVYNGVDVSWVKDELVKQLETDAELTLCVHDRDWLAGIDIVDNIVQSIESSRKTLLIVSNAFAISQWCQLEMTLAQHRLLVSDRNALILVLLEPLKRDNVTPRLSLQMKQQTYMEWTEDPVGQRLFWKKIRRALLKPTGSIMNGRDVQTQPLFID